MGIALACRVVSAVLIIATMALLSSSVARADVAYGKTDRATVRVFALGGVKTIVVHTRPDESERLAMPEVGHGSGIRVGSGLILTAYHVVEGARIVAVRVPGSPKAMPARVVAKSRQRDFAFLAIPNESEYVLPLPEQAPRLQVRQTVFAVGYPLDAERERPQSTQGIVSGVLKDGRLQLGMSVNPGNSGGPVVDENENLVGLLVARGDPARGVQGIAVAVPLESMTDAYQQLAAPGGKFEKALLAVRKLGKADWARAELTAALAQTGSALGIVREATKSADGKKADIIWPRLAAALKYSSKDPDVHAVAAAYHWNAAAVLQEFADEGWRERVSKAKRYARRALHLDSKILQRSPFVRTLLSSR